MQQTSSSSRKRRSPVKRVVLWWGFWSLLVALGLALGCWQWSRAVEKQAYLSALSAAPTLIAPREVPPAGATLTLEGTYLAAGETRYLDNRTHGHQLGVAALTPLRTSDGRLWLIERGFLATGTSRDAPAVASPEGPVTIKGQWQPDGQRAPLFGDNQEGVRLQRIQLDAWEHLGDFAHAGWLHLEEGPGGLTPWWEPSVMPSSRHLGYAVQWWGLAAAALLVMWWGGRRLRRGPDSIRNGKSR